MLILLARVRKKQEEELTHSEDNELTFSHMELKLLEGQQVGDVQSERKVILTMLLTMLSEKGEKKKKKDEPS